MIKALLKHRYLLLLLVLPLIVFWRHILPLPGQLFIGGDAVLSFYTLASIVHQIKAGTLPLWDPHTFFGVALLSRPDSLVFYPPLGLLVLFSAAFKVSDTTIYWLLELVTILHFSLAGIFTFFLLKKYQLSDFSAFLGGLAYMFCGALVVYANTSGLHISLVYFPLIILLFDNLVKVPTLRRSMIFALAYALQIMTFALTTAIVYHAIFLFFYYIFLLWQREARFDRNTIFFTGLSLITSILLSAVVMLPGFQVPLISDRANLDYHTSAFAGNLKPRQLFDFLIPFFSAKNYGETEVLNLNYGITSPFTYSGILALLLIAIAFLRKNAYAIFYGIAGLLWLLLTLGGQTPVFGIIYVLFYPLMKSFSEPRIAIYIAHLCIAVLAAYGAENLIVHYESISKPLKRYKKIISQLLGLCFIALIVIFFKIDQYFYAPFPTEERYTIMTSQLNAYLVFLLVFIASAGVIYLAGKIKPQYIRIIMSLVIFFDLSLFVANYPLNIIGIDPQHLYSNSDVVKFITKDNKKQFYRSDVFATPHNYAPALNNINHTIGYLVVFPRIPVKFLQLMSQQPRNPTVDSIASVRYVVRELPMSQSPYKLVYERKITAQDQTPTSYYHLGGAPTGWIPVPVGTSIYVYENTSFQPLARIVNHVDLVNDDQAKKILESQLYNATTSALIADEYKNHLLPPTGKSTVTSTVSSVVHRGSEVTMKSKTKDNAILVTSLPFYSEWHVTIDGKIQPLLRVNLAFMGVSLPPGEHEVRFYYVPVVFYAGLAITSVSLIFVLGILLFYKRRSA